jgi:Rrf2 family protein
VIVTTSVGIIVLARKLGPSTTLPAVRISAKADYAVRLSAELAIAPAGTPVTGPTLAGAQDAPLAFCENILGSLRTAGIVQSRRGAEGGYLLARPAADVTVADVIRAVDGPLGAVHGEAPETIAYPGPAAKLADVWIAVRASVRDVLERVTLADLAAGRLPAKVEKLAATPDARRRR